MPCKFVGNASFCSTHYMLSGSAQLLSMGTLWMQEPLFMSILTSSYRNALSLFLADQFGDIWVASSWRFHYGVISWVGWIWCACSLIHDLSSSSEVVPWSPSFNWQPSCLAIILRKIGGVAPYWTSLKFNNNVCQVHTSGNKENKQNYT